MKKPLLVLILILSTLIGCGDKEEFVADVKLPLVKVKTITTENFTESYNISGVVKPIEEATISAVEGGLITHLAVDKVAVLEEDRFLSDFAKILNMPHINKHSHSSNLQNQIMKELSAFLTME